MVSYINIKTPISCHNSCDGILEAVLFESDWDFVTWGAPTSYSWVLNSGTPHVTSSSIISGCCSGVWEVTVSTTFGGGHSIGPITVIKLNGNTVSTLANPTIVQGSITDVPITCFNGTNGGLNLSPTGGTGIYTFYWTSSNYSGWSSTVQNPTNLGAGYYTVVITDSNGCTGTISNHLLANPSPIELNPVTTDVICPKGSTGTVDFTDTTGGTAPYQYSINGGTYSSTQIYSTLVTGDYTVRVKDANNCSRLWDFTIFEPDPWIVTSTIVQPSEITLGSISLLVSGATGPYTYLWSTGATTSSITNLNQGTYTVTISDTQSKGSPCTTTRTYTLNNSCPTLTFSEFKVFIMRTQCCFGKKVQQHNSLIRQGRQDLADCMLPDLMLLEMILKRFYCIEDIQKDICWSCQDLDTLMNKVKNICECDCCEEDQENIVQVNYNSITNSFDVIN